jgi:hypothetical protein
MDRIEEEEGSREGDAASMQADEEVDSTESVEKKGPPIAPPPKNELSPNMPNPDILVNYIPAHWKDKTDTDCSEVGSNIKSGLELGSVWDLAGMPESYFGDSDPEAETPVRGNSVKDFDVTTGSYGACPFMEDYSADDESADVLLLFDLDNHNNTDPTEDSENLRTSVIAVTQDDVQQDGDEIRHSMALTLTDEEGYDEVGTISPSSTSEGTNSGEEAVLSWSAVSEDEEQSSSSSCFKDAKQTFTDSMDTSSTKPHEVAVVTLERSVTKKELVRHVSPDVSWPRAHAKGEWTQIDDSTTVKVAHAHAKGEWAQTKGSSAIKVEYLQFFTPEIGKVTNEMKKVIKEAPAASSTKLDFLTLQPTKAPTTPSSDDSQTDESKGETHNSSNASIFSSKTLEFYTPKTADAAQPVPASDESATDEATTLKEETRFTTPISSKSLDFIDVPQPSIMAAASLPASENDMTMSHTHVKIVKDECATVVKEEVPPPPIVATSSVVTTAERVSPLPVDDENHSTDASNVVVEETPNNAAAVIASSFSDALDDFLIISISPQPPSRAVAGAASSRGVSPEENVSPTLPTTTQDENATMYESNIVVKDERLSRSNSHVSMSQRLDSDIVTSPQKALSKKTSPPLEVMTSQKTPLHDKDDKNVLQSWAQTVMNKLMNVDKNQKLLSM